MSTHDDVDHESVKEHHNWNFVLNVASSGFDGLGLSLVGIKTVLPAFLTLFTKSNVIIGLLPALHSFCWTFPQIVTSFYTGHFREKKNVIVFVKVEYALPWLVARVK